MNNNICVLDFETGGRDPSTCEPIEIAAKVYYASTLEPIPDAEFCSLMKPLYFDKLEKGALDANGITIEQLKEAPEQKSVWLQFIDFVNTYNPKSGNPFTAPVPAGNNIKKFDMVIVERMAKLYGPLDKEGKCNLFYYRNQLDLLDVMYLYFNREAEPANFKLPTLRDYFGISKEGEHRALKDVEDTGLILMRFMKYHRALMDGGLRSKMKGLFANANN